MAKRPKRTSDWGTAASGHGDKDFDGHCHGGDGHAPLDEVTSGHDYHNPRGQKIGNYGASATATIMPAGGYWAARR